MQSYKYSDKKEKNNDIFSWLQNKHHIKKRKHSGKHISDETEKRLCLLFFSVRECRRYIKKYTFVTGKTNTMDVNLYKFLMGTSSFIIAILGVMLATTILPKNGLDKLRKARSILVPSYFILALLSLVCCLTGYDRFVEPTSTLFVASFQALLFTMSMLVFIRPGEVLWRTVFRQAVVITVAGIVLFIALFCFTDYYSWFFYIGITAYVIQMTFYTRKFTLAYRKTVQEVDDYYDDDEESRLRWVKIGFYTALAIGVMAMSIIFYPGLYKFFVPLYVLFYSFMVMWFVNYYRMMKFAIPVISATMQEQQTEAGLPEAVSINTEVNTDNNAEEESEKDQVEFTTKKERMLHERLQQYIDLKEFCQKDVPSEAVVASLGTTKSFLRRYMNEHYGIWFSTWRNELRIHEACILWNKCPNIPITDMTKRIGYANNGNFCRDFKKIVGITPKEYCMQVRIKSGSETSLNPEVNPLGK